MKVIDEERVVGMLSKLKREKGINDEDLSDMLGISRVTLQKRRYNGRWLGKELALLADALKCSMDDFTREVD